MSLVILQVPALLFDCACFLSASASFRKFAASSRDFCASILACKVYGSPVSAHVMAMSWLCHGHVMAVTTPRGFSKARFEKQKGWSVLVLQHPNWLVNLSHSHICTPHLKQRFRVFLLQFPTLLGLSQLLRKLPWVNPTSDPLSAQSTIINNLWLNIP